MVFSVQQQVPVMGEAVAIIIKLNLLILTKVLTRDGKYIPATPIPGTIVVNIGDLMQRWAADVIVSNVSTQYF